MGNLAVEQQTEPIGMGQCRAFAGGFEFGKGLGHAGQPELGELIEYRLDQQFLSPNQLVVVAGSADVAVEDRRGVAGSLGCCVVIELVIEDRAHRAVGQGADLDGAHRRGFEAIGAKWPQQADDAEAGTEALFGMRLALQDQLA
jgi:hypothetical protein